MVRKRVTVVFLLTLTAVSLYFCYLLFRPFLNPLLSALVIAVVFFPIHANIQRLLRHPSLAALASTIIVVLLIIVPAVAIILAIKGEVADLYTLIDQKSTESGGLSPYAISSNGRCNGSRGTLTYRKSTCERRCSGA